MLTADMKTDGTKYVVIPTATIRRTFSMNSYDYAEVTLIDLDSVDPDASPSWRHRGEKTPIKARYTSDPMNKKPIKRTGYIWLSARRVIMTRADWDAQKAEEAAMRERWDREQAMARTINTPLAAALNSIQIELGLVSRYDALRPMLEYSVDQYGGLRCYEKDPDPAQFLETLREFKALKDA